MGGFGSGRQASLPLIENGLKIDLRRMRKHGQFVPDAGLVTGHLAWTRDHSGKQVTSIGFKYCSSGDEPWFEVEYTTARCEKEPLSVQERFPLERFPQPYGGYRWYFICPQSGKRAQCLYLPPGASRFRSRHGFQVPLQYRSQCQDSMSRPINQMHKIARKVLNAGPPEWRKEYRDWDFPPKPPGMHWRTYERLEGQYGYYDETSNAAFLSYLRNDS